MGDTPPGIGSAGTDDEGAGSRILPVSLSQSKGYKFDEIFRYIRRPRSRLAPPSSRPTRANETRARRQAPPAGYSTTDPETEAAPGSPGSAVSVSPFSRRAPRTSPLAPSDAAAGTEGAAEAGHPQGQPSNEIPPLKLLAEKIRRSAIPPCPEDPAPQAASDRSASDRSASARSTRSQAGGGERSTRPMCP